MNHASVLEAILFASGDPVPVGRIAEAMQLSQDDVIRLAEELGAGYDARAGGFMLVRLDDKLQLCSRPAYFPFIRAILEMKRNTPLSQAAMETLAVIAYHQPVTKGFVEQVRGVECGGVVNNLCERGLIEERGRLDLPGRPIAYGTTDQFLRCFSLESLAELPQVQGSEGDEGALAEA